MKFSVVLSALFAFGLTFSAQAGLAKEGYVACKVAKTDFSKKVEDADYYTVLKQMELKIGEQTEWMTIPGEGISVSFFTGYIDNNPKNTVYLSLGLMIQGYEIWSAADTYRGGPSRFATSISKGKTQYEVICIK